MIGQLLPNTNERYSTLQCSYSKSGDANSAELNMAQVLLTSNGTSSRCDLTEGVIQLLNEYYCVTDFF